MSSLTQTDTSLGKRLVLKSTTSHSHSGETKTTKCSDNIYFNIYTTGLSNWQSYGQDNQNLIRIWNNGIRESIINLIPANFQIKLYHYDPLLNIEAGLYKKINNADRKHSIDYINHNLILNDYTNNRVNNSIFIDNKLNLETIQTPYIILDIAHIFIYPRKRKTVRQILSRRSYGEELILNSVRFGFIGDELSLYLAKSNIFKVTEDGQVITYIDKMIDINNKEEKKDSGQKSYDFDPTYPLGLLEDIYRKIVGLIERKIKEIKEVDSIIKIEDLRKRLITNEEIIKSIVNYIWNDFTSTQIIMKLTKFLLEKNMNSIVDYKLI